MELATAAFAGRVGSPASTGALLAVLSLGSAVGGMAYGMRARRRGASVHILALSAARAVALILLAGLAEIPSVLPFGGQCSWRGCVSPDELSDSGNRTQASAVVNTVNNLGTAVGTGATGLLLDHVGPASALLAGGLVLAGTSVAARLTMVRSRLEVPQTV
jgi:predicted MFS family arabinose efflux permease